MVMTVEKMKQYLHRLEELKCTDDVEVAHWEADNILLEILTSEGYIEIVNAWEDIPRWYA